MLTITFSHTEENSVDRDDATCDNWTSEDSYSLLLNLETTNAVRSVA